MLPPELHHGRAKGAAGAAGAVYGFATSGVFHGLLAAVALLLALAGVYGVMAYTVNQRVPEIGLRIALGASPRDVLSLVMREGATLVGLGLIIGAVLSYAGTQFISGLLFGVSARDPLVFATVAALVALTAIGACTVPGRRALKVDPLLALRAE